MGIGLRDPLAHARGLVGLRHVRPGEQHERRGLDVLREVPATLLGVGHVGGVDDLHETAEADGVHGAAQHELEQRGRFRDPRALDDDGVEVQCRAGQGAQGVVQLRGVLQAAQAAARDRQGFRHVARHETGVHVHVPEVVDHHSHTAPARGQDVVEHGGLAGAQVAGEDQHGDGTGHGAPSTRCDDVGALRRGHRRPPPPRTDGVLFTGPAVCPGRAAVRKTSSARGRAEPVHRLHDRVRGARQVHARETRSPGTERGA